VVVVFAVRKNRTTPPPTPTVAATLIPVTQVLPSIPQPIEPSGNPTPVQNTSPELTVAMELVAKNPKDPDAHLTLALALLDAKEIPPAMEELMQAANLAGPNNKDFFLKAAQKLKVRGAWAPTANMYLRLAQTYRKDNMPKEILNDFHEAIYKAAEQKDMPLFVPFERIENTDTPLSYLARGRYALFYGSPEDAKIQLAKAEKEKPEMHEVALLKAEIEMKTGNQAEAKNILLSLSSDPKAPEWIRFMAENYLKTIQ
jgi:tetratricopeptide (TPR) repeat protein